MEKIKAFVAAFKFALRGGQYQVKVKFNDPMFPSGIEVLVGEDASVNVDDVRARAQASTWNKLRRAGLTRAAEGEGFYVKWATK